MPTYTFRDMNTGEEFEAFMKISELDEFRKNQPNLVLVVSAPGIVGGTGDRVKTDGGFKDVLKKIGDAHPGSELHSKHGSKDIKREKSLQVIKKHSDIQAKKKYNK